MARKRPGAARKRPGGTPPAATRWKKGQSGNPKGAPKDPKGLKRIKALTKVELVEIGNMLLKATYRELKKLSTDQNAPALHALLAGICIRLREKGDMTGFDKFLDRLIGKVRENVGVEHSGFVAAPTARVVITMPSNGREAKP